MLSSEETYLIYGSPIIRERPYIKKMLLDSIEKQKNEIAPRKYDMMSAQISDLELE